MGTPTKADLAWGLKSLTPHRAAGYAILSNRLERMSAVGYEPFVRKELIKTLRLIIHEKLIQGTGTNNEVIGIDNVTGMTTTAALSSAGQFTVREASDMIVDLQEADIDTEGADLGFLMRPIVLQGMAIQRLHYFSGQTAGKGYVFAPIMNKAGIEDAIGAKIATTTHVATSGSGSTTTSKVTLGDWSRAMLALWTGLVVRTSTEASDGTVHAFTQGAMMVLAEQDYDFLVTRPDTFCRTSNAYANRGGWDQA
jgi:HK97 family phage major capsid protein